MPRPIRRIVETFIVSPPLLNQDLLGSILAALDRLALTVRTSAGRAPFLRTRASAKPLGEPFLRPVIELGGAWALMRRHLLRVPRSPKAAMPVKHGSVSKGKRKPCIRYLKISWSRVASGFYQ